MSSDEVPVSISLLASLRDSSTAEEADAAVRALVALIPDLPPQTDDEYYIDLYRAIWPGEGEAYMAETEHHGKIGRELLRKLWDGGFEPPVRRSPPT